MPAVSQAQRKLIGLAEHRPEDVSEKNRGILSMSHSDMHDFASTKEKGLPKHKGRKAMAVLAKRAKK